MLGNAEDVGEREQPVGLAVTAARTADDPEHEVARGLGIARDRLGHGADRNVGAFVRLQPPHVQHEAQMCQVQALPRGHPVAWREQDVIDAGRNQTDVLGVGSVQTDELAGLQRRRGQDPIRCADHAFLALQPHGRLGPLIPRERVVLHFAERVERGDERRAPDLLGRPAHPAREPVVAVDDVVRDPVEARIVKDPAEELGQVPGQVRLRHR